VRVSGTSDYAIAVLKRLRGATLRLVRRRRLSIACGSVLIAPAAWVEFIARDPAWWLQGLALVVGGTGIALAWTGITGASPDWIEDE
jgi:hypothetical protein